MRLLHTFFSGIELSVTGPSSDAPQREETAHRALPLIMEDIQHALVALVAKLDAQTKEPRSEQEVAEHESNDLRRIVATPTNADKELLEGLVDENRRLAREVDAVKERAELQAHRIDQLLAIAEDQNTALGRFKTLSYVLLAGFIGFVALIFTY